jgi:hypothetical protein
MSLTDDSISATRLDLPVAAARPDTLAAARPDILYRLPVYFACTMLAVIANYLLGKDLPWDTLNYHLYAGFSAVNDRFGQDYFAAGPPSYFNPYAYVPFYALVRAGLSPLAISSVLAMVQSVILWMVFELAVCVCPSDSPRRQMTYGVCAVAMASLNPILVQQIGSSFADTTTAVLVLGGWLLLAQAVRTPQTARVVCAGLLIGVATALKPTNSVHAIAAFALLIILPRNLRGRIRYGMMYAAALALGFAIVTAPWSYRLEQMFGNPLFPLMNGVFRSPEFTTEPLRHFRFIPDSLLNALWRPFAMANPVATVQEELTAPDVRYAALILLAGALLVKWLRERFARSSVPAARAEPAALVLAALGCGFATDWVLWLSASGNGRYFLPMASVASVLIVALIFRLLARPKLRNYVLAVILGTQATQLCFGASLRWTGVPWDRHWLGIEMPARLVTEPNLYLTAGVQSNSFIAPFLAKGSGLVNFSGAYALGPDGATGARIDALIRRYAPHLRVLWRATKSEAENVRHDFGSQIEGELFRFGLRMDPGDCLRIALQGLPPEPEITNWEHTKPIAPAKTQPDTSYLMSCRIVPDDRDRAAEMARERDVDVVFDRIEDACPALFQPRRPRTQRFPKVWQRFYINTDIVLSSTRGAVKFIYPVRGGPPVYLGLESDWAEAPAQLACGRRDGYYFATVLDSGKAR